MADAFPMIVACITNQNKEYAYLAWVRTYEVCALCGAEKPFTLPCISCVMRSYAS